MDKDDEPKSIAALFPGLIVSSNGCVSLPAEVRPTTDPVLAVERAKIMFGCYRKGDAADPETYAAAVAAVLADYPLETVLRVTNPVHGLPSKANWLPSVKEVREACDAIESRKQWLAESAQRERDQIAARRREDASRKQRPTLDELKANHGENWGLRVAKEETAAAQRRDATLRKANKVLFERECIDNGMPANSPISPSLAALIKAGMA